MTSKIEKQAEVLLPTEFGRFRCIVYHFSDSSLEHVALVKGNLKTVEPVLVRVHSECLTGEVFKSKRCDCGPQFDQAMEKISRAKRGVLIYLRQEGRGIGLLNKIKAYALQKEGLNTFEANQKLGFKADERKYDEAVKILVNLGVQNIRLMTNNPQKVDDLEALGVHVSGRVPLEILPTPQNRRYLVSKKEQFGHFLKHV